MTATGLLPAPVTQWWLHGETMFGKEKNKLYATLSGKTLAEALTAHLTKVGRKNIGLVEHMHIFAKGEKDSELVVEVDKRKIIRNLVPGATTAIESFVGIPKKEVREAQEREAITKTTRDTIDAMKDKVWVNKTFTKKCNLG
jgi:hypothetical protein